jgi:hypothetical protein
MLEHGIEITLIDNRKGFTELFSCIKSVIK